jgi:hypothetical protein
VWKIALDKLFATFHPFNEKHHVVLGGKESDISKSFPADVGGMKCEKPCLSGSGIRPILFFCEMKWLNLCLNNHLLSFLAGWLGP